MPEEYEYEVPRDVSIISLANGVDKFFSGSAKTRYQETEEVPFYYFAHRYRVGRRGVSASELHAHSSGTGERISNHLCTVVMDPNERKITLKIEHPHLEGMLTTHSFEQRCDGIVNEIRAQEARQ